MGGSKGNLMIKSLTSNFRIVRACHGFLFKLPFSARLFEMFVYNEGDWKVSIKKVLVSAVAVAVVGTAFAAQDNSQTTAGAGLVRFDSVIANGVLVPQAGTETDLVVLKARQQELANQTLYVGGMVRAAALYSRLSDDFSASNPHTHVTNGREGYKTASQLNMPEVAMISVADINSWATGVIALSATNVGRDNSSNDSINVAQAYALLGDLNSSSVYGFVGKKEVDFGNFTSVDFYTLPLNNLAFRVGAKDSLGVGFNNSGFNAVFTALNGGPSDADGYTTAYTQNSNNINNFAVNLDYGMTSNNVAWGVGAGYLNGGRYSYAKSDAQRNGAWDINGHFNVNSLQVMAEYDRTSGKADTDNITNSTVQGYDLGAAYGFPIMGHNSSVNADFSRLETSAVTASQFVLGWNNELVNDVWMGVEWAYNKGSINGADAFATEDAITAVPGENNDKNNTLLLNLTATF